ncbi:VWA-like domain-containing protein [Candidatus Entotheonella palauensis]|uniref:VWA-like domain-containing protein n=1 Tax=Candidatus Entotheonella palauensis TaxID=93172 RepID=UPI000B7DEAF2|nr:VWA-like domain-containing protein [Candidatus Entotheonella palauensis]
MLARDRMTGIVEKWFLIEPLLFAVWTAHELVINPRIRTIRAGRGRIEYNPLFIDALTRHELEDVLTFEALRIVLKHPYTRRQDLAEWAYAASNLTLQEYLETALPFPRAQDVFGDEAFDKQYYEFYYYKLLELVQTDGLTGVDGGGAPSGGGADGGNLATYADPSASGQQNTESWGADELQAEMIDDKIRTAHETQSWGTVAGRWRERILASLRPKLNYRAVLRQFRTSVLSVHRRLTRMKPNRRYGFLYMGSRYDFTTRLLVAVDVSGSMPIEDVAQGFSVVNRFFTYGVSSIDVIQFDTEIQGQPMTLKRARREIEVQGRGGTNFSPVIDFIDEHVGYDGLIVFTDGYAPVPRQPVNRRTRILWLFTNETSYNAMYPRLRQIGRVAFLKGTDASI